MPRCATIFVAVLAAFSAEPKAGEIQTNPKDGQSYAWIPQRATQKGFWLGTTEVTAGAYKRFVTATGGSMPPDSVFIDRAMNPGWRNDRLPIVRVTWDEAVSFCGWAGGRLPSEDEWDYAARSGTGEAPDSDLDAVAWYADNSGDARIDSAAISKAGDPKGLGAKLYENGSGPHEVGLKRATAWGLFDMLGNVWEWTVGPYDRKSGGKARALRGGSWGNAHLLIRVSARGNAEAGRRSNSIGLRCALDQLHLR